MHVHPPKTILDGRQEIDLVTSWSHAGLRRFPPTMQSVVPSQSRDQFVYYVLIYPEGIAG